MDDTKRNAAVHSTTASNKVEINCVMLDRRHNEISYEKSGEETMDCRDDPAFQPISLPDSDASATQHQVMIDFGHTWTP